MKKVSILIATYNSELYIKRCLDSLLANTMIEDCNLFIVDDSSTDNTVSIINSYDKNITLIKNTTNKGICYNRQKLLDLADGKYFIYVDSDDYVEKNYIEKLYNAIESYKSDIVGCNYYLKFNNKIVQKEQDLSTSKLENINNLLEGKKLNGFLWNKIIRKEFITENKIEFYKDINFSEDTLFIIKAFLKTEKINKIDDYLYFYDKTNSSSLTNSPYYKKMEDCKKSILQIEEILIENNAFESTKKNFLSMLFGIYWQIMKYSSFKKKWENRNFVKKYKKEILNSTFTDIKHNKIILYCYANNLFFIGFFLFKLYDNFKILKNFKKRVLITLGLYN